MKIYEQLYFNLLKEYQTNTSDSNLKPKTLAVTAILKKANVTDQNILKAITDILEKEEETSSPSPQNPQQTSSVSSTSNGNLNSSNPTTPGIKP